MTVVVVVVVVVFGKQRRVQKDLKELLIAFKK